MLGTVRGETRPFSSPVQRPELGDVPARIIADLGPFRRTEQVLERVFQAAQREILITNPYFIPPDRLVAALARASRRGVHVHVLVPGKNNHPVAGLSIEERAGVLLDAGVLVYRWGGPMIHAKSVVVDGTWTLVGSSNLDHLSLRRNSGVECRSSRYGRRWRHGGAFLG